MPHLEPLLTDLGYEDGIDGRSERIVSDDG